MMRLVLLFLVIALPARAEEIVLGLSQNQVAITATFDGSDILIFGAVKRERPIGADPPLEVIVTVAGPDLPLTVWRRARRMGIWVNAEAVEVEGAPSFYAVATTDRLSQILSPEADEEAQVSIARAIGTAARPTGRSDPRPFGEALVRIRSDQDLFQLLEGTVHFQEQTLFRTSIALPANVVEGNYDAHIYLTRGGEIVDSYRTTIAVQKVGLERWLYALAHEQPLIYGLLSLAIAVAAGWLASAVFGSRRT